MPGCSNYRSPLAQENLIHEISFHVVWILYYPCSVKRILSFFNVFLSKFERFNFFHLVNSESCIRFPVLLSVEASFLPFTSWLFLHVYFVFLLRLFFLVFLSSLYPFLVSFPCSLKNRANDLNTLLKGVGCTATPLVFKRRAVFTGRSSYLAVLAAPLTRAEVVMPRR